MHQVLYRKWRPLRFDDIVGQEHITETIKTQIRNGYVGHAYLFTGTRGTGKTSCAKVLSRAVNCENPQDGEPCNECDICRGILNESIMDVMEIDAATNNKVDNIRSLREDVLYTPERAKMRVYIIDEVHMLTTEAFNALLKTLEEPPEHVMFILATTEVNKLPATILSRCQRFDFKRISPPVIAKRLLMIAKAENIDLTEDAAMLIASLGDGSMRDALSVFDRCVLTGKTITVEEIQNTLGLAGSAYATDVLSAIIDCDLQRALCAFEKCYLGGVDISSLFDEIASCCRDLMILKAASKDAALELINPRYDRSAMEDLAAKVSLSRLICIIRLLRESMERMRQITDLRLEAELCIVSMCSDQMSSEPVENSAAPKHASQSAVRTFAQKEDDKKRSEHEKKRDEIENHSEVSTKTEQHNDFTDDWIKVLKEVKSKLPRHAYIVLSQCEAKLDKDMLEIYAESDMNEMVLNKADIKEIISGVTSGFMGRKISVKIMKEKEQEEVQDDFLETAQKFNCDIEII